MDRREFLKVAGGAIGGMALFPLLERSGLSVPLAGEEPVQAVLRPEFTVFATPSGSLRLTDRAGLSLGTLTSEAFALRVRDAQRLDGDTCGVDSQQNGRLRANIPSQGQILSAIPATLLPIARGALDGYARSGNNYTMGGLVVPTPVSGGILLPSDYLPLRDQMAGIKEGISPNADIKGRIGNYFWRLSVEKHFIGGCIKRNVWHAGAMVKYVPTDRMIFDLHIAGWWQGWTPCFGIYESASGWCRSRCTWNIWDAIFALALAAAGLYVAAWLANALAAAIATGSVGLLIAIPGVPPPP